VSPPKPVPTDLELELLQAVRQRGQATVREVYQDLLKQRKIAYTTVLTMMGILENEGASAEIPRRAGVRLPAGRAQGPGVGAHGE
jgi:hypothetical protein